MRQPPDVFTIERHGDLTVIAANPALETIDASLEEQVAEVILSPLRGQEGPLLVFDLSAVNYFGSMFLAVLLRCWKLAISTGGSLVLAGVSDQAKELLRITSLDMILPMYATRQEAMEALLSD
jgi:anti-anti-sigma factor